MSYIGAYQRKYKYPGSNVTLDSTDVNDNDLLKPQYRVGGLEPDVADANLLDEEIADIGRKLGAFANMSTSYITPEQMVANDELLGNRINVVGSDETASTVEPEVRRIFGEYQTAAFLDSLSDSDESDAGYDDGGDDDGLINIHGGDDNINDNDIKVDGVGMEKSYHGINYYEVDNNIVDTTVLATELIGAAELNVESNGINWEELLE